MDENSRNREVTGSVTQGEDVDDEKLAKDHFRRRILARYRCASQDHTLCFVDEASVHHTLTEESVDIWVEACVRVLLVSMHVS